MPVSKAQQASVNKYVKSNYDRINVTMPKGKKETIQVQAEACEQSVNAYINSAIDEKMERDTGGPQEAAGASTGEVVALPPEALKTAQEAAEAAGEAVPVFVARAIESRATLDKRKKPKGGQ